MFWTCFFTMHFTECICHLTEGQETCVYIFNSYGIKRREIHSLESSWTQVLHCATLKCTVTLTVKFWWTNLLRVFCYCISRHIIFALGERSLYGTLAGILLLLVRQSFRQTFLSLGKGTYNLSQGAFSGYQILYMHMNPFSNFKACIGLWNLLQIEINTLRYFHGKEAECWMFAWHVCVSCLQDTHLQECVTVSTCRMEYVFSLLLCECFCHFSEDQHPSVNINTYGIKSRKMHSLESSWTQVLHCATLKCTVTLTVKFWWTNLKRVLLLY